MASRATTTINQTLDKIIFCVCIQNPRKLFHEGWIVVTDGSVLVRKSLCHVRTINVVQLMFSQNNGKSSSFARLTICCTTCDDLGGTEVGMRSTLNEKYAYAQIRNITKSRERGPHKQKSSQTECSRCAEIVLQL